MREKILKQIADWHAAHPGRMLAVVLVLTLVFAALAAHLRLTMRWSDLLPAGDERTIQFNRIVDEFASASNLVVVVQGEERRMKRFADRLAPLILKIEDPDKSDDDTHSQETRLFQRVDYKAEVDFLKQHGLLLIKEENLKDIKDSFTDPHLLGLLSNLNNSMEKEYVGQAESISTREREDQAVIFLDGIQDLLRKWLQAASGQTVSQEDIKMAADKLLWGEPYYLSYDKKALIMLAIPTFDMTDTERLISGTDKVQELVDELLLEFPDVKAGLTGFVAIGRDEMVYSEHSLGYTTLISVMAILFLLMMSFRMWVAPLLAIGNLLIGLVWALGTVFLVVGQLNIMTSMMAVILLGLGIDFSIHLISGFTEQRAAGGRIPQALEQTFLKVGKGVITGGLTTACAFLTLVVSHSRGMKEMGLVTGTGLLAILLATFFALPVMLVLRERLFDRKHMAKKSPSASRVQRDISFRFLGRLGAWFSRRYIFSLGLAVFITLLMLWSGSKITFDHNYLNIEPKGIPSVTLQDTILEKFDLGMDYALVIAEDADSSRAIAKEFRRLGSVAFTEDISIYLPSSEQYEKRIPHIREIREKIGAANLNSSFSPQDLSAFTQELERLEMNLMEMQDMAYLGGQDKVEEKCQELVGDPDRPNSPNMVLALLARIQEDPRLAGAGFSLFQEVFAPYFKNSVKNMSGLEPIRWEELPVSILDRFCNSSRNQFLVTVFPAGSVWKDSEYLKRFTRDLEQVTSKATGMPPVFRALIEIIGRDGRIAIYLTLLIVFFLLWLDFQSPWQALMAMIPLGVGIFWMVGFMRLVGMQITVMNVMGLPMIIGIGIDDGVHIVHRWRQEGRDKIQVVFSSTGKAILLTSLTTMLAFGSLVFAVWRGFGHLGGALFLGVAACFLATILILSAVMGIAARSSRKGI